MRAATTVNLCKIANVLYIKPPRITLTQTGQCGGGGICDFMMVRN